MRSKHTYRGQYQLNTWTCSYLGQQRLTIVGVFMIFAVFLLLFVYIHSGHDVSLSGDLFHFVAHDAAIVTLDSTEVLPMKRWNSSCTFHKCVNVHRCGYNDRTTISVYIYPVKEYVDEDGSQLVPEMSVEFAEILDAITDGPYHTDDPSTACLFVPSLDLLNEDSIDQNGVGRVLASLPFWNGGSNHLLFNMLPGVAPTYQSYLGVDTGKALLAGGAFSIADYRSTFDVSIPIYNPLLKGVVLQPKSHMVSRAWTMVSAQLGLHPQYKSVLRQVKEDNPRQFLWLDACPDDDKRRNYTIRCDVISHRQYRYPDVLQEATFSLVLRRSRLGSPAMLDSLMAGCVPVVAADGYVLPFFEVVDWLRAAVLVREDDLPQVMDISARYSLDRVQAMRRQVNFLYHAYFHSIAAIATTTLRIINDRIFPYATRTYHQWNNPPDMIVIHNPLLLPRVASGALGFTMVLLAHDRLDSLFILIRQVGESPSLAKVLVVWNNPTKDPPPESSWPNIGKPVVVHWAKRNRLNNRFYPYDEIDTDCILTLDDDILMLTKDELEFGYQVWREFPDRLVGFPSRLHLLDDTTGRWRYEPVWTNAISMVLTGAAFYHKYFNRLYTESLPGDVKAWVDAHRNCDDIAMNFLIANVTGNAPVKVGPRKKFRCGDCANAGGLSAGSFHMNERSECINHFASLFHSMPLRTVEFRADPVLFMEYVPAVVMKYPDIGSL